MDHVHIAQETKSRNTYVVMLTMPHKGFAHRVTSCLFNKLICHVYVCSSILIVCTIHTFYLMQRFYIQFHNDQTKSRVLTF